VNGQEGGCGECVRVHRYTMSIQCGPAVVDEAVVEHAQGLVRPQADKRALIRGGHADHGHALEHLGQVPHVVGVVALGGRRQQLLQVGPVTYCSPRHKMLIDSRNEVNRCSPRHLMPLNLGMHV